MEDKDIRKELERIITCDGHGERYKADKLVKLITKGVSIRKWILEMQKQGKFKH
jgi:hypothetical protein